MGRTQASQEKVKISKKEKQALELRDEGKTIRQIAAEMGCSIGGAYNYVWRGIRKLPQEVAKRVRDKEVANCDLLIAEGMLRTIESEDLKDWLMGVKGISMQQDRKSRFLGLDAPRENRNTNIEVTASDEELRAKALELLGRQDENEQPNDHDPTQAEDEETSDEE